jgi:hypothetical protein
VPFPAYTLSVYAGDKDGDGFANTRQRYVGTHTFVACLIWSKTEEESRLSEDLASPLFTPEEIEIMGACGLDDGLGLEAWLSPRRSRGGRTASAVSRSAAPGHGST